MNKRSLLKAMAAGLVAIPAAAFAAETAPAAPAAGAPMPPPPGPGCGCPPPPPPPCGCPGRGPQGPQGPHAGRGPRPEPWMESPEQIDRMGAHVAEKLKITDAQKPAFNEWLQAKKDAAASRGKLRDEFRAAKGDSQAQAELHLKAARARLDGMEKVVKARGNLMKVLDDDQKKLFERFEHGHGPKGPRGPRPGMRGPGPQKAPEQK